MKRLVRIVLVLGCVLHGPAPAAAETYPSRSIRMVVAYPAGGATDVIARAVSQRLSDALHNPVVIDNKGGASTQIGAGFVVKAPPDGYTLLATDQTTMVNAFLYSNLGYDPATDLVPVTGLGVIHQALAVHPTFPLHGVTELIAAARAAPGRFDYATLGIGSTGHLSMAMFEHAAGVSLTPVHYKGGAPALVDLIAGHVPMAFLSATLTAQPAQAGQLRLLGVGSTRRLIQFPAVPTVAESLPGYESSVWFGVFAPRGTPPEIVTTLNEAVQAVLIDPAFGETFLTPNFYEPLLGSNERFAAYVRSDTAKWQKVVQDAHLSIN